MAAIGMFDPPIKRGEQGAHPDGAALQAANIVLYFLMKRSP
ncbi:MAG: hypothetical protein ABWY02_09050 [Telluria sp.]